MSTETPAAAPPLDVEIPENGKLVVYNRSDESVNAVVRCQRIHIEPQGTAIVSASRVRELMTRFPHLSLDPALKLRRPTYEPEQIAAAKALPAIDMACFLEALMLGQTPPVPELKPDPAKLAKAAN